MGANTRKIRFLAVIALAALLCTPLFGLSHILPHSLFDAADPDYAIFWNIRLPRTLGAFLAGAGLSLSGLVFQTLFRNPLATPYTLGIAGGAALGASLYFRLGAILGLAGALGSSLLGCLVAMLLVYAITTARGGSSTAVMLLAGVIVNFFFSSLVMFVQYASNAQDAVQIMRWLMGSVAGIELSILPQLCVFVFAGAWFAWQMCGELNLLSIGEELAAARGVDVRHARMRCFILGGALCGAVVSVTGPIGFVGMMAPQICRLWLGWRLEDLLPSSMLLGGIFLVLCDLAARIALAPVELPIGIVTAMLGGPFFLWMLFRGNGD